MVKELLFELRNEISELKAFISNHYNGEYIRMGEAANFLRVSLSKMQKLSASGVIAKFKPGNGIAYFKKEDLFNYLKRSRVAPCHEFKWEDHFNRENGELK